MKTVFPFHLWSKFIGICVYAVAVYVKQMSFGLLREYFSTMSSPSGPVNLSELKHTFLDNILNDEQIFKPHWRYGVAPAKRLWPDVTSMGVAIAKALQRYLPAVPRGSENWTHRLLRRTYASILHALHAPETLIQRQLLHECADAIDNYVVLYSDEDRATL